MFEEYTRGLVKRLDDVTKFSTLVGDMFKRTNDIFTNVVNCTTEGGFGNTVCKIYDIINMPEEVTQTITINAVISEDDPEYKPFVGKVQLTIHEQYRDIDENHHCNTASTLITIYPGGQVYIPNGIGPQKKTNIYRQTDFNRCGHTSEISVGNFDKNEWAIEHEIDPDNKEYFKLKCDWDREMLRRWFSGIMKSIDEIYNTNFYVDEDGTYDLDRMCYMN